MPHSNIVDLIYKKVEEEHKKDAKRDYIGFSCAGDKCDRRIWLTFNGYDGTPISGRNYCIFERGQREEEVAIKRLESIGVKFSHTLDAQLEVKATDKVKGHMDGIIEGGVPGYENERFVFECKTHCHRSFKQLVEQGVKKAKYEHWAQVQCYMKSSNIHKTLYFAVNKDTDNIYTEIIEYDPHYADVLTNRLIAISTEQFLPPPLSENPTWWECKKCLYHSICFKE